MGNLIETHFARMGARVLVRDMQRPQWPWMQANTSGVRLNVLNDARGGYFDIQVDPARANVEVVDVQPRERHLLLMSRSVETGEKEKFLCGHDERAWFVAAVPGRSTSNVKTAFEALKPPQVLDQQARRKVSTRDRRLRKNRAYVRQGEWFFIPDPNAKALDREILRNEMLRRGNGKPHIGDYCFSTGGQRVYVSARYPNGLLEEAYEKLVRKNPAMRRWNWRGMVRNAGVYVRGRVRHPDHKTIELGVWHRVWMNTESEAPSMRHVAFLD